MSIPASYNVTHQSPLGSDRTGVAPVGLLLRWAFYLFMFSLPFESLLLPWMPTGMQGYLSLPRMAGLPLLLVFLLSGQLQTLKAPRCMAALVVYVAVSVLSATRAESAADVVGPVLTQVQSLVLFVVAYNLFLTGRVTLGSLSFYLLASAITATMICAGVEMDPQAARKYGDRLAAFGADPNTYAVYLMVAVLFGIGIGHIRKERKYVRLPFVWGAVVVTLAAIGKSASRGVTLALAVGVCTLVLRRGTGWTRIRNAVLICVIAGFALWILSQSEILLTRWTATIETGETSGRDVLREEAIQMFRENPVFGVGPQAQATLADRLRSEGSIAAVHNNHLEMLIRNGVLGFTPFLIALVSVFFAAWRSRSGEESVLPLALFMALFVIDQCLGGGSLSKVQWVVYSYILAAGRTASLGQKNPPSADPMGTRRMRP
jgi:O-antigen ligase